VSLYADIPKFPRAYYEIDIEWNYLELHLAEAIKWGLDLDPDFQRAHVWTYEQQVAYVEYMLRGGEVGRNLTFNCLDWDTFEGDKLQGYVIVDGKQRLEAVRRFLRDDLRAFGHLRSEYTDRMRIIHGGFKWRICNLATRKEVLQLYLNINAGGTPHTPEEIERVRTMLMKEARKAKKAKR